MALPGVRRACLGHPARRAALSVAFARPFAAAGSCGSKRPCSAAAAPKPRCLQGVRHILAVASGKGGVGKSSIAVNLAYLLAGKGARVGVLDADVYGPSLPVLIGQDVKGVLASKAGGMLPPEHQGVNLMSMGYLRPGEHAALRGPLVSSIVQQMLNQTEWGELDYLVIDMPPGTGDIHLTIAQSAQVNAAVVVSTPQSLSLADVEKGITMFNKVNIPTIAVVENMSFFLCGNCNTEHAVFDKAGKVKGIAEKFGVPTLVQLPLDPELSSRTGGPFVLDAECRKRPLAMRLEELADAVASELEVLKDAAVQRTVAAVSGADGRPLLELTKSSASGSAEPLRVEARTVRLACRSAAMWDELTGEKLFREEDIPLDVHPTRIRNAGSYAVHIDWSDRHVTLMPYTAFEALCRPAEELV